MFIILLFLAFLLSRNSKGQTNWLTEGPGVNYNSMMIWRNGYEGDYNRKGASTDVAVSKLCINS